jgi:hypothetical protein
LPLDEFELMLDAGADEQAQQAAARLPGAVRGLTRRTCAPSGQRSPAWSSTTSGCSQDGA